MVCTVASAGAQNLLLKGRVYSLKMEPVPLVEVRVKELQRGTTTNELGKFELSLPEGRYEVVYSAAGFRTYTSIVILQKETPEQQVLLEESEHTIDEVTVTAKSKDQSKDVIRKVIAQKEELQKAVGAYSFEAYIKANESRELPKINPQKVNADSIKILKEAFSQFAEVMLKVSKAYPDKIKEERLGLNIKGNKYDFYYLSCTEGDYNFYDNLIRIPSLSAATFLSPISRSGLFAYRYKYLGMKMEQGVWMHHIQFKPSKSSNALLEGEVWIQDEVWAIKKMKAAFPNHQTPEFKSFEATVTYDFIQKRMWLPVVYEFNYQKSADKSKGSTIVRFDKYNIDTLFRRSYFNTELSATSDSAYHRDSIFWKQARPVPLSSDELKVIRYKDSIYELTHSDKYRDSIEAKNNKITLLKLAWSGQGYSNWRKEKSWYFPELISMIDPLNVGGVRLSMNIRFSKVFEDKRSLFLMPNINYGFLNKDIRGTFTLVYLYNPFKRSSVTLNVGRNVDNLFWDDSYVNLLMRNGYFLKDNLTFTHRTELLNGLYLQNKAEFGIRRSMANYKFYSFFDTLISDKTENRPIDFKTYNALFYELELSYTPYQMYMREPKQKVVLGSKYPTFYAKWRKGIPGILGSKVNYDYIEAGVRQELNLGTLGISTYNVMYGNYINEKNVEAADYKRIARGNPGIFYNPMNAFQSMDSTFALFKGFGEGHLRHEFNGAIINKIPYAKYLKLYESAGVSFLYAPERKLLYGEVWIGLEKELTLFRRRFRLGVYGSSSWSNSFQQPLQIKIGLRSFDPITNAWN